MKRKLKVLSAVLVAATVGAGVAAAASSPSVVTGGVSLVRQTSAVLHGTVNPNGRATAYAFQWGLTTAYGATSTGRSAGGKNSAIAVNVAAGGLIPGTVYHYRLVAISRSGTSVGADRNFKTAGPPPPSTATGPASLVTSSAATVTGVINPNGAATTWEFQYGLTAAYTNQTIGSTLPAGGAPLSVASRLTGLAPGTIFHYRIVALHGTIASSGGLDAVFMTLPAKRPVAGVTARTKPGTDRRRPFTFTTSGSISPRSIPGTFACNGEVTVKFLIGSHRIGSGLIPVAANCTFSGVTTFRRLPHRGRVDGRVHLRVLVHFGGNGYLAPNRAKTEHVTMG
jgi:phosphodiesterase/alkaline phosphatase D-like protein